MKLFAINVILAVTMLFNAFGINGQQELGEAQAAAIGAPAQVSNTPTVSQTTATIQTITVSQTPSVSQTPTVSQSLAASQTPTSVPTADMGISPTPGPTLTTTPTVADTIAPTTPSTATAVPTTTPKIDKNTSKNKEDFKVSFKSPYLNKNSKIDLKYQINPRFASVINGAQLSINLLGNHPSELFRIAVPNLKDDSKIIVNGCDTGCKLEVDLLQSDGTVIASDTADILVAESFAVPMTGGEFKSKDGKITVKIGGNALKQDANFYIVEGALSTDAAYQQASPLMVNPFIIDAAGVSDEQDIHVFDEPIQIIYNYADGEFKDPGRWSFTSFNEITGQWELLTTELNSDTHQIIGYSNHLSNKALEYNAVDKYKFDNLASAQTSLFTGAATYSYPINVPTGVAGLTPSVSLTYNSNTVDNASILTQASWVGMGWDLDVGSITRNTNGTNNINDDTFNLSVNGAGGVLIPYAVSGTGVTPAYVEYKTQVDNFMRIRRYTLRGRKINEYSFDNMMKGGETDEDASYWVVWDKSGTKYTFGDPSSSSVGKMYYLAYTHGGSATYSIEILKWGLVSVQNAFWNYDTTFQKQYGTEILYTYAKKMVNKDLNANGTQGGYQDDAMYLDTITYGGIQFQIKFNHILDRSDFVYSCVARTTDLCSSAEHLLDSIDVYGLNSTLTAYVKIKTYKFTYDQTGAIFPNVTGHVPALSAIQEFGTSGTYGLPQTTFTYGDKMHLTQVNNGYNGAVKFTYETAQVNSSTGHGFDNGILNVPWGYAPTTTFVSTTETSPANVPINDFPLVWWSGSASGHPLSVGKTYSTNTVHNTIYPGGLYRIEVNFDPSTALLSPLSFDVTSGSGFIINKGSGTYPSSAPSTSQTYYYNIRMPIGSSTSQMTPVTWGFSCGDSAHTCKINWWNVGHVVTRYRVVERDVYTDFANNIFTKLTYQYGNGAVNDYAHSTSVSGAVTADYTSAWNGYSKFIHTPNSEFMGHDWVVETRPDGGYTITNFNQVGVTAGRVEWVDTYDSAGNKVSEIFNTYGPLNEITSGVTYNTNADISMPVCPSTTTNICLDAKIYYYDQTKVQNYTYATNWSGQYIGTQQKLTTNRDSTTKLVTSSVVENDEIWNNGSGDLSNPHSYSFTYNKSPNNISDTYYQVELPEVQATCDVNLNNGLVDTAHPYASCGSLSSNYLSEQVLLYTYISTAQTPQNLNFRPDKSLNLLSFLFPSTTVQNGYNGINNYDNQDYSASQFAFDKWGNVINVYAGQKKSGVDFGSGVGYAYFPVPASSTKCYGDIDSNSACYGDSRYGTFLLWEQNAKSQQTTYGYNATQGLLTSVTDPNNAVTQATYDEWGRMISLTKPLDLTSSPTFQASYNVSATSFWIETIQRVDDTHSLKVRKFYNGLDELIQTQQVGVQVSDCASLPGSPTTCTTIVDQKTEFDATTHKKTTYQTAPYVIANQTQTAYVTPTWQNATKTVYDTLGRAEQVTAPDGASQSYTYGSDGSLLKTTATDPKGNQTQTWKDVWGRTTQVTPAAGPGTSYTYDKSDHLLTTTYGTAVTSMTYDIGGRKLSMNDPDMGYWTYTFNEYNNLISQTDARGCMTNMTYDVLNRLTDKNYTGNCPGTNPAINYSYDATGVNGIGRRTGMRVGADTDNNKSSWTYDVRGHIASETKTIPGLAAQTTYFTYNSADQVVTTTYPGTPAEVVTSSYNSQMALNSVVSDNTYTDKTYVQSTTYDAAGRVDVLTLGATLLQSNYDYNPWTSQGGRLSAITSGTTGTPDSLQKLQYNYDADGNIKWIEDWKAGAPETRVFNYDGLNRLTGVGGAETDAALFDNSGNLKNKALSQTFIDDFSTANSKWTKTSTVTVPCTSIGSCNNDAIHTHVIKLHGTSTWLDNFYSNSWNLNNGQSVQFKFKMDGLSTNSQFWLERLTYGDPNYRRFGIFATGGTITVLHSNDGTNYINDATLLSYSVTNGFSPWFVVQMTLDDVNGFKVQLYQEDNPANTASYTVAMQPGLSWRFMHDIYSGNDYVDDYREFNTLQYTYAYGPTFFDDFTTATPKWVKSSNVTVPCTSSGSCNNDFTHLQVIKIHGSNTWTDAFYSGDYNLNNGKSVQFKFKMDGSNTNSQFWLEKSSYGNSDYRRFGIFANGGTITVSHTSDGTNYINDATLLSYTITNGFSPWFVVQMTIDDANGFKVQISLEDNPALSGTFTVAMPTGLYWRFMHSIYTGNDYVDDYSEFNTIRSGPSHAVSALSNYNTYTYDANGNMIGRHIVTDNPDYALTYDAENRLVSVNGQVSATFVYDADGNRVKTVIAGVTTYYVGNYYEVSGSDITKYYYAGGQRVAMRKNGTLSYLFGDNLGSTTVTADSTGANTGELRYFAWGETRYSSGTTQTSYHYTGQKEDSTGLYSIGLYYYNARYYDPYLNRWVQPDTDVPESQGVLGLDRYAYVNNSPVNFNDPTGHNADCASTDTLCKIEVEKENASNSPAILDYNLLDWIPVISQIRGITRGSQVADLASDQPGFTGQQTQIQGWYNNCYGMCHYADSAKQGPSYSSNGGPMPKTPLVDTYSAGAGEVASNVVDLGLLAATGTVMRSLPEPKLNTPRFGIRIAPFGNAGDGPLVSQLPHFHFRIGPALGSSYDGFGWHWHHPWEDLTRLFDFVTKTLK